MFWKRISRKDEDMAVQNQLAKKNKVSLSAYLTNDAVKNQINKVVGGGAGTKFISSLLSAVQTTPALQDCTNQSLVNAALLGEALKLSPSPQLGHFYMVPFKNNKKGVTEAQFQLGWKGYYQLAMRSGQYKKIRASEVKQGELKSYDPITGEAEFTPIKDPAAREQAETIGYYAFFVTLNGTEQSIYWPKEKMEIHAETYSQGYRAKKGYTFWEKNFDAMAIKTMYRQLISKYGIMSIDIQTALEKDMAVIGDDEKVEYVDSVEDDFIEGEAVEVVEGASEAPAPAAEDATKAADAAKEFFDK